MRRLYKYLVTLSLCLPASCGKNGSDGPAGTPGAPGSSGSDGQKGGSSLVTVYDKSDKKVGWLLSNSAATAYLPVLLTNGFLVTIEFSTGRKSLDRNHSPGTVLSVYYNNTSCSSIGATSQSRMNYSNDYRPGMMPQESWVGPDDSLVTGDGVNLGTFAYQSVSSLETSGSNAGKVICSIHSGSLQQSYGIKNWFQVYPPLSLRAE